MPPVPRRRRTGRACTDAGTSGFTGACGTASSRSWPTLNPPTTALKRRLTRRWNTSSRSRHRNRRRTSRRTWRDSPATWVRCTCVIYLFIIYFYLYFYLIFLHNFPVTNLWRCMLLVGGWTYYFLCIAKSHTIVTDNFPYVMKVSLHTRTDWYAPVEWISARIVLFKSIKSPQPFFLINLASVSFVIYVAIWRTIPRGLIPKLLSRLRGII